MNPEGQDRRPAPEPSIARQKTYIVENAQILDDKTKKLILSIVMIEVGRPQKNSAEAESEPEPERNPARDPILENETTREVSIDLDAIENPDVLRHIYNAIKTLRDVLSRPAGAAPQ